MINMRTIDNRKEIIKIDKQNILGSVEALPRQCLHAWEEANKVHVPASYRDFYNVTMCGMGGSGLGARVIESLCGTELKEPLTLIHDYHLPRYVDHESLVICSSYSGETEETIQNAKEAIEKKAKWMAIGTGGTLIQMAKEQGVPFYQINPKYNPSNQPRMAIGYSLVGQLTLANRAGLINLNFKDIQRAVKEMRNIQERNKVEVYNRNGAKKLAVRLKGKMIFFASANHLIGATHVFNNQINENSKVFSADFVIPELNHHLMEGLTYPEINRTGLFAIFVDSGLYSERVRKRLILTKEVVEKHDVETFVFVPKSDDKLSQVFELIQFGVYTNFYLSILYEQDPGPIPWVDYFKKKLGQPHN